MEAVLEREGEDIAAVIVEPLVQCAAGMRMYDASYLALLREGPLRYSCEILGVGPEWGSARIELFDGGSARRATVGRVVAAG